MAEVGRVGLVVAIEGETAALPINALVGLIITGCSHQKQTLRGRSDPPRGAPPRAATSRPRRWDVVFTFVSRDACGDRARSRRRSADPALWKQGDRVLRRPGETDSIDRRVAVQGESAKRWLAALGYDVTSDSPRVRAGGDVIRSQSFAVGRLWHDASRLTRRGGGGGSAISLVVEGRIRATRGTTTIEVGQGEAFLDALDGETCIEVEHSVGSIELRVNESFPQRYGVAPIEGLQALGADLASLPWLLSLANAMLASREDGGATTWPFTRTALENLVAAVMVEANEPPPTTITDRALAEIRRSCTDPTFDVAALAASQSITSRWLQAAFAARDLTPRQAIRRERLRTARCLLEAHPGIALDDAAGRAGFPSARALREALRADGVPVPRELLRR